MNYTGSNEDALLTKLQYDQILNIAGSIGSPDHPRSLDVLTGSAVPAGGGGRAWQVDSRRDLGRLTLGQRRRRAGSSRSAVGATVCRRPGQRGSVGVAQIASGSAMAARAGQGAAVSGVGRCGVWRRPAERRRRGVWSGSTGTRGVRRRRGVRRGGSGR